MDKVDKMEEASPNEALLPNDQEEMTRNAPYNEEIAGVEANIVELQENDNDGTGDNHEAGGMAG